MRMNRRVVPMIFAAAVAALALPFASAANAQQPRIERLEIIGAGFIGYDQAGVRTDVPDAVGGKVILPKNMRFLADEPKVTAQIGTSFGVRFMVVGEPKNADVMLRTVWKIPSPGLTDPKSGKRYSESTSELAARIGTAYLAGYGFNEQWEIVPGVWTLQVWQGGGKLLEHNFTIR
jgi:hypothetical protein